MICIVQSNPQDVCHRILSVTNTGIHYLDRKTVLTKARIVRSAGKVGTTVNNWQAIIFVNYLEMDETVRDAHFTAFLYKFSRKTSGMDRIDLQSLLPLRQRTRSFLTCSVPEIDGLRVPSCPISFLLSRFSFLGSTTLQLPFLEWDNRAVGKGISFKRGYCCWNERLFCRIGTFLSFRTDQQAGAALNKLYKPWTGTGSIWVWVVWIDMSSAELKAWYFVCFFLMWRDTIFLLSPLFC